jgi:hypothetical protein
LTGPHPAISLHIRASGTKKWTGNSRWRPVLSAIAYCARYSRRFITKTGYGAPKACWSLRTLYAAFWGMVCPYQFFQLHAGEFVSFDFKSSYGVQCWLACALFVCWRLLSW